MPSKMFVSYHISAQRHNPEDHSLNLLYCENPKSQDLIKPKNIATSISVTRTGDKTMWKSFVPVLKHCLMGMYEGVEIKLHTFLTSAPVEGKWSALCPSCFSP
jgi:hypothetical protein